MGRDAFLHTLRDPELEGLLLALVIVALSLVAAMVARKLLGVLARKASALAAAPLDENLLRQSRRAVSLLALSLGLRIALAATGVRERMVAVADSALFLLAVATGLLVAVRGYQQLLSWWARRLDGAGDAESETLSRDFLPLARSAGIVVLAAVALTVGMAHFGQSVSSLVVSLGVGSLALGLAAQDTLANMIAGFLLLVDRPFRCGDRVELSPGQAGDVLRIGLRATRLRLLDGSILVAPNSDLVKSRLVVVTGEADPPLLQVKLFVAYDADPAAAKRLAREAACESPLVLPEPAPKALLVELGTSSLVILVLAWIADVRARGDALDDIHSRIFAKFQHGGVRFQPPVTEVRLPPALATAS